MKINTATVYVGSIICGVMLLFMTAWEWCAVPLQDTVQYAPRVVWPILGLYFLISGLIKVRHPYIISDSEHIAVHGARFSNVATQLIPWSDISAHEGRTFTSIVLRMKNGTRQKIPINGMRASSATAFLELVEKQTETANKNLEHISNSADAV